MRDTSPGQKSHKLVSRPQSRGFCPSLVQPRYTSRLRVSRPLVPTIYSQACAFRNHIRHDLSDAKLNSSCPWICKANKPQPTNTGPSGRRLITDLLPLLDVATTPSLT